MSLSKVIKKESLKDWSVCGVNYEALLGNALKEGEDSRVLTETDGFTPLFYNDHFGADSAVGDILISEIKGATPEGNTAAKVDVPNGMMLISEEELQEQLNEAYAKGAEEGRQVAERGLAHVFKALRGGADSLVSLRERILRESEGDLLRLATMVAKKIILQEIRQDKQILANIIVATVNCCSEQEKITIRLSPEDYKMILSNRHMLEGVGGDESRVTLASDSAIKLGGCLVETPTGTVDARIESQLDEVYNRCMEERGIPQESLIGVDEEGHSQ